MRSRLAPLAVGLLLVLASVPGSTPTPGSAQEAKVQRQLLGLLGTRERQAEAEVRAAVAAVRGNRAAVAAEAGD